MKISKADFQAYEDVRSSGVTNMFDIGKVSELSGLDREMILEIIKNYATLLRQYPDVRKA